MCACWNFHQVLSTSNCSIWTEFGAAKWPKSSKIDPDRANIRPCYGPQRQSQECELWNFQGKLAFHMAIYTENFKSRTPDMMEECCRDVMASEEIRIDRLLKDVDRCPISTRVLETNDPRWMNKTWWLTWPSGLNLELISIEELTPTFTFSSTPLVRTPLLLPQLPYIEGNESNPLRKVWWWKCGVRIGKLVEMLPI